MIMSWIFNAGMSILLAARLSHAQLPSSTSNGNLSITTTSPIAPTGTGDPCCVVVPINVGLNFWWNETLTATVATVLTQVYQYNNTRITSTTTISANGSIENATAPVGIIPGTYIYSRTIIGTETVVSLPNTMIASPTPFVAVAQVGVIYGTWEQASGERTCAQTTYDPPRGLDTAFGYVEDPPTVRTTPVAYANAPPGTEFIDFWIQQTPTITDEIPGLKTCSVPSGSGEPSVHVPVTGLTSHATTTINVDGGGPAPPVSTSTRVPAEPITTPEPTQTNAPEPEPTKNISTESPPAPTTEPEQPAPTTEPNQPAPTTEPNQPAPTTVPEQPRPTTTGSNPNPPGNSKQPTSTNTGTGTNPNPNPSDPEQPAPTTGDSPNNPQQPVPTTAGTPDNSPSNSNPAPVATLPIDLTPVPAPAPAPTTAGAPPGTQPVSPPGVILPNGETLLPGTATTISDLTLSIPTNAPSATVIGGTTVQAPPVIVVDGTTATLAATSLAAPALSVTVGEGSSATVVSMTAVPTPGGGVVLPNGETLLPGSTVTYLGETLVLTTATAGDFSVVQVIDSSTTEIITVPTAASPSVFVYGNGTATGSGSSGSGSPSQTTSAAPEEATGGGDEVSPGGTVVVIAAMGAAVILGL